MGDIRSFYHIPFLVHKICIFLSGVCAENNVHVHYHVANIILLNSIYVLLVDGAVLWVKSVPQCLKKTFDCSSKLCVIFPPNEHLFREVALFDWRPSCFCPETVSFQSEARNRCLVRASVNCWATESFKMADEHFFEFLH